MKNTEEIISSTFYKKDESLYRIIRSKRNFNDKNIDKYTAEDFKKAFKELNIDFLEPKLSILEPEMDGFKLLKKIEKVNYEKKNKTELERYILNRLLVISDYYKPFKSFDIKFAK